MAKHDKSKGKAPAKPSPKPKFTPKQAKEIAATPMPKRRGDPQIGQKRKIEARSAAIGRGIMKQM